MAENPPYMNAYGLIPKILSKLREAPRPEKFTQDFLGTKLGFSGGSAKAFIPFAKRLGLIGGDGSPTELYTKFRSTDQAVSGFAMAQAIRTGYKDLYDRNEYAHDLTPEKLQGLIVEVTGLEKGSSIVRSIQNSFLALKEHADFGAGTPAEAESTKGAAVEATKPTAPGVPESVHLAYTIYLNLPETTNVAVFNAIFKSLKEHLLQG